MKLLLDECVDTRLRLHLPGHNVFSVRYLGWDGLKNGELLQLASANAFEAMITIDQGLPYQHNPNTLAIAVICLQPGSDRSTDLLSMAPQLLDILKNLPANAFTLLKR